MRFSFNSVYILLQAIYIRAAPNPTNERRVGANAAFFLAGDSTTATQSTGGGGWGNGFLTTLASGSFGINYGHNGRTTATFVSGGDWATVLASVAKAKASYATFVTIQFGHNDQKSTSGVTLAQYSANLKQMGLDVKNAGGDPILVTPITRRNFSGGKVIQDLAVQANATIAVAKANGFYLIDLNAASTAYVNAIGATNAAQYNLAATDYTHLNSAGSVLFGIMVSVLLDGTTVGSHTYDVSKYTHPNSTIAADIKAGKFILPSGFGTLVSSTALSGF